MSLSRPSTVPQNWRLPFSFVERPASVGRMLALSVSTRKITLPVQLMCWVTYSLDPTFTLYLQPTPRLQMWENTCLVCLMNSCAGPWRWWGGHAEICLGSQQDFTGLGRGCISAQLPIQDLLLGVWGGWGVWNVHQGILVWADKHCRLLLLQPDGHFLLNLSSRCILPQGRLCLFPLWCGKKRTRPVSLNRARAGCCHSFAVWGVSTTAARSAVIKLFGRGSKAQGIQHLGCSLFKCRFWAR